MFGNSPAIRSGPRRWSGASRRSGSLSRTCARRSPEHCDTKSGRSAKTPRGSSTSSPSATPRRIEDIPAGRGQEVRLRAVPRMPGPRGVHRLQPGGVQSLVAPGYSGLSGAFGWSRSSRGGSAGIRGDSGRRREASQVRGTPCVEGRLAVSRIAGPLKMKLERSLAGNGLRIGLAIAAAASIVTACSSPPPPGAVLVPFAPPPAPTPTPASVGLERLVNQPDSSMNPDAWIRGDYRWNGSEYVWVTGRWEKPPQRGAVWVNGRWLKSRQGWYWVEGYWRQGAVRPNPRTGLLG